MPAQAPTRADLLIRLFREPPHLHVVACYATLGIRRTNSGLNPGSQRGPRVIDQFNLGQLAGVFNCPIIDWSSQHVSDDAPDKSIQLALFK